MLFSIITTSYNAGDKLNQTVKSVLAQSFTDYEIIVKDAGSTDGSVEKLQGMLKETTREETIREETGREGITQKKVTPEDVDPKLQLGHVKVYVKPDQGVYDGMNQALEYCMGDYVLFLNCGDVMHDAHVLEQAAKYIENIGTIQSCKVPGNNANSSKMSLSDKADRRCKDSVGPEAPHIFYGNTFCHRTNAMVHSAPAITGFTCYRNIPCHQSCFYDRQLFVDKKYDLDLKIRADYDHFLWCFYRKNAICSYMDLVVADYEGGGISESKENQALDKREHELIIRRYMTSVDIWKYKLVMAFSLAPLRRYIAESSSLSGAYHKVKNVIYGKRSS